MLAAGDPLIDTGTRLGTLLGPPFAEHKPSCSKEHASMAVFVFKLPTRASRCVVGQCQKSVGRGKRLGCHPLLEVPDPGHHDYYWLRQ